MFSGENTFTHAANNPNNTNEPKHSKHNVGFISLRHNNCITRKPSTSDDTNDIIVIIIDITYIINLMKLFIFIS